MKPYCDDSLPFEEAVMALTNHAFPLVLLTSLILSIFLALFLPYQRRKFEEEGQKWHALLMGIVLTHLQILICSQTILYGLSLLFPLPFFGGQNSVYPSLHAISLMASLLTIPWRWALNMRPILAQTYPALLIPAMEKVVDQLAHRYQELLIWICFITTLFAPDITLLFLVTGILHQVTASLRSKKNEASFSLKKDLAQKNNPVFTI